MRSKRSLKYSSSRSPLHKKRRHSPKYWSRSPKSQRASIIAVSRQGTVNRQPIKNRQTGLRSDLWSPTLVSECPRSLQALASQMTLLTDFTSASTLKFKITNFTIVNSFKGGQRTLRYHDRLFKVNRRIKIKFFHRAILLELSDCGCHEGPVLLVPLLRALALSSEFSTWWRINNSFCVQLLSRLLDRHSNFIITEAIAVICRCCVVWILDQLCLHLNSA